MMRVLFVRLTKPHHKFDVCCDRWLSIAIWKASKTLARPPENPIFDSESLTSLILGKPGWVSRKLKNWISDIFFACAIVVKGWSHEAAKDASAKRHWGTTPVPPSAIGSSTFHRTSFSWALLQKESFFHEYKCWTTKLRLNSWHCLSKSTEKHGGRILAMWVNLDATQSLRTRSTAVPTSLASGACCNTFSSAVSCAWCFSKLFCTCHVQWKIYCRLGIGNQPPVPKVEYRLGRPLPLS